MNERPETTREIQVTAPSRLHFGLLSFGNTQARQFGGVGVMIERPSVQLAIRESDQLQTSGPLAERVGKFAARWSEFHELPLPDCHVEVRQAPRQHTGLGTGTQLALSVAAGLLAFQRMPLPTPAELAISVGRGLRSAVGTYGFAEGGLIVERGKQPREPIAPLDCQIDVPAEWRFVLVSPRDSEGRSGRSEQKAFRELPPVPQEVSERLASLLCEQMIPAVAMNDFDQFSASVFQYGHIAGSCFAACQGGPYNGPRLSQIVELIRLLGCRGVGQSSWGPTLFAVTRNADEATGLIEQLRAELKLADDEVWMSAPNNTGAQVSEVALGLVQRVRS